MSHDLLVQMACSPFFYVRMKSTLFLVTKLRLNRYCEAQLMWRFYKKGKNGRNRLRLMSVFNVYNYVYRETFFFPLGNLSLDPGGKKTRIVSVLLRRTHSLCNVMSGGEDYGIGWGLSLWIRYVSALSDQNPERTQPKLFPRW